MAEVKVYTLKEVTEILQVSRRTVYNYIKADKLHAFKMGKYWRVTEESLRDFIGRDTPVVDGNRRKEHQEG